MVLDIPNPYVGAYLGVFDPEPPRKPDGTHGPWQDIPAMYEHIRFDAVDILHLGHCVASADGHFGVGTRDNVVLSARFESIVKYARWQKPNIKIIAEQFYGESEGFDGWDNGGPQHLAQMIETYTNSVRDFLKSWQDKGNITFNGKTISMRLDGYNIDYEDHVVHSYTKDILTQVRAKLDKLTQDDAQKRPFIVGITPAFKIPGDYDRSMAHSCNFINMQRYSGGQGTKASDYLSFIQGLTPSQLTYGIEIETPSANAEANNSIDKIVTLVKNCPSVVKDQNGNGIQVAGFWTWRLGSKWELQNLVQVWLFNLVHSTKLEYNGKVPDLETVKAGWTKLMQ